MVPAFVTIPAPHHALGSPATAATPVPPTTPHRVARRRRNLLAAVAAGVVALALGAGVAALAPTGDPGLTPAVPSPPASAAYLAESLRP